jgi:hypothetical protein
MPIGIFYCSQIPIYDLAEIDWLIQNPVPDRELEEDLEEEVWMVEYDADHPDMQFYNRDETCIKWGFIGTTFEDEARLDDRCAIFPGQQFSLPANQLPQPANLHSTTASLLRT